MFPKYMNNTIQANKLYFEGLFSKCQCGFRQGLSVQYCLIAMLKTKRKKSFHKGTTFAWNIAWINNCKT